MYEQSNKANFQVVTCLYPKLEMYYQIRAVLYPPLYLSIFFSSLRFFPVLLLLRPFLTLKKKKRLPWWCSGWESACQCREHGFEPWSGRIPHAAEQLGLCATTTEPALSNPWATTTEACAPGACAPQEKPPQWEAYAPQRRVAPTHHN